MPRALCRFSTALAQTGPSGGITHVMSHLVLEIETDQFPSEPEGDLDYCNGMPGSYFASWIKERLQGRGINCLEVPGSPSRSR